MKDNDIEMTSENTMITMLKGKLHRATVTEANLEYEGSVAIDSDLMNAAGILPYEQVDIYNITSGERLTTYAITAEAGSGEIGIQGAAAHKANKGDLVIICAYIQMSPDEAKGHQAAAILLDENNRIKNG